MKTLQTFASVHGTSHHHFNQERHLVSANLQRETLSRLGGVALSRGIISTRVWVYCVQAETSCRSADSIPAPHRTCSSMIISSTISRWPSCFCST